MRIIDGRLLLSATDLSDFLSCGHLTQLSLRVARGETIPVTTSGMRDLVRRLGEDHESKWLSDRDNAQRRIKRFDADVSRRAESLAELEAAHDATVAAMREGWEIIYQPFFFDGCWQGRADFLIRVEQPSALGDFAYEVADAKLARYVRARALLQLCEYSYQVGSVQGRAPEQMRVILGDGTEQRFRVGDFSAYHLVVREQLQQAARGADTYPDRVSHCRICDFADHCDGRRRVDDHLSLVARMRQDQIRKLNAAGVISLTQLGTLTPDVEVPNVPSSTLLTLREQARLQLSGRRDPGGRPLYELLPQQADGFGLAALPAPSPADVFFDLEGDPYAVGGALQYLFGAVHTEGGAPRYRCWLGHDSAEERRAFESFVDWAIERLDAHPEMHIYHYGDYERSALQQLMGRHGTRESEVDRLLRGEVLVDLYRVVRQSVRLSTEAYGLKQIERLYMMPREANVADGEASIVMYEEWLRSRDEFAPRQHRAVQRSRLRVHHAAACVARAATERRRSRGWSSVAATTQGREGDR